MNVPRRVLRKLRDLPRVIGYGAGPRAMSLLRKHWLLFRHPHADIVFEGPVHIGRGFGLHMPEGGRFVVGPGVEFRRGFRAEMGRGAEIRIGANTVFTYDVLIQCSTVIDIGADCAIGQCVFIADGNHRFRDHTRPMLEQGYDFRPITIADGVAITSKTTVIHDIGKRCYIGANSVVSRPIPAWTVAVGAPAKAIDYFGPPGEEPPELAERAAGRSG
jgi:acetyltransferase-like isoleucine patch superfamily enzyme